ncbi:DUF7697 family protein [Sphingomonas sp. Leaf17]|nr:hypothetical protein [Sphingomonas sp. Leaf17]
MGQPFALDFTAVMAMGQAASVDMALLADVLPAVEAVIVNRLAEAAE